ncbi:nitrile hydratase accessory protein [Almyronema epifaneia]|uniref:Nitrile hydratase accessory protein n=1 Tax=Almyronema epifaneia S1 TaxID=2991925 RepID=A0ABW6IDT9_9CYAN
MPSSLPNPLPSTYLSAETEPVFQAPWEAKAFAIVNQLAATQRYSWAEWTNCLVQETAAAEAEANDARTYYERWVDACQKLLIQKGILDADAIDQKMVELSSDQSPLNSKSIADG